MAILPLINLWFYSEATDPLHRRSSPVPGSCLGTDTMLYSPVSQATLVWVRFCGSPCFPRL